MTPQPCKTIFFKLAIFLIISTMLAACQPANGTLNTITIPAAVPHSLPQVTLHSIAHVEPLETPKEWISYTNGNDISEIAIDSSGNLWSAGRGGVVEWNPDGKTYRKYTTSDGLPENYVTALAVAPGGKIWAGTHAGQVSFFSAGKWTILDGKPGDAITDLAVTTNGTVWIGTNHGLHSFDGANWRSYTSAQGLLDNFVQAVAVTSNGTVWAAGMGGVSFFNGSVWEGQRLTTGSAISSIAEAPDQSIWFGSDQALLRFDGKSWTSYETEENASLGAITSIAISKQGDVWFTSARLGLVHFDEGQKSLISYALPDISGVVFGPDDRLWLGGYYKGLSAFTEKSLDTYTAQDANITNFITSSAMGQDGTVWFGSNQGALAYNQETWKNLTTSDGLANNNVISIAGAPDGSTWFGTADGISYFDGLSWKNFTTQDGLLNNQARALTTTDGTTWLVTQSGLSWYDGQKWNTAIPPDSFTENTTIRAIAAGADGAVWIGTKHGLSHFNGQRWTEVSIPLNDIVTSIAASAKDDLWIGTLHSGIFYVNGAIWEQMPKDSIQSVSINPDGFRYAIIGPIGDAQMTDGTGQFLQTYTQDQGLPSNNIHVIKVSADGSPWIATNKGVAHLTSNGWLIYTTQNGLGDDNVQTLLIDQQGNIWAGMPLGGIAQFIP